MTVPNEKNLKPVQSKSEAARRGRMGGKASGVSRRKRKALKENMELLLNLGISGQEEFNELSAMGIPMKAMDNAMLLTVALFRKAAGGDVAAWKEIRDLIGEAGPGEAREGGGIIELQSVQPLGEAPDDGE